MENIDILEKAKKDLKNIEQKLWIQAYVSRKENPLIDFICSILLLICSYIALYRYFTKGVPFPFWVHAVAFIVITACMAITHRFLNHHFTKKAEKICPITTSNFNTEDITNLERLSEISSYGYFDLGKKYYAGPLSAFLSIVFWIISFFWLSNFHKLPVPSGGILYLIVMCVVTSIWFFFTGFATSQTITLPLSLEVKKAIKDYKREIARQSHLNKTQQEAKEEVETITDHIENNSSEIEYKPQEEKPKYYRDLPLYKQYREEARYKYNGQSSSVRINRTLTNAEMQDYINKNFYGMYSFSAIQTIENDPNLTLKQKEDLKRYLQIYGD